MPTPTKDLRISSIRPLISPDILEQELPVSPEVADLVAKVRLEIQAILNGEDDRLLVVIGPCSIHDIQAALDYAKRLKKQKEIYQRDLLIVMRVYFEKPRTTIGWKGLINDPNLNDSFDINQGLHISRQLLIDINKLGLAAATEFLDVITPQYVADLIAWGAIGARTTESQIHRQLASGLSMPVGFKNGTGGSCKIALDAILSAAGKHHFLSVTEQGISAIVETTGNQSCHLILRGSSDGPNYDADSIGQVVQKLGAQQLAPYLMIDCSHGNSQKQFIRQIEVAKDIEKQVATGQRAICSVMIESNLVEGTQSLSDSLVYGQSITDACLGWEDSLEVLAILAKAVQKRRKNA